MIIMKNTFLPILLATLWISVSEFVRNSFLLHNYWIEHYQKLGIIFPEQTINGAVWGIWSFCFAISIFILSKKYSLLQTTFLSWFVGFVSYVVGCRKLRCFSLWNTTSCHSIELIGSILSQFHSF